MFSARLHKTHTSSHSQIRVNVRHHHEAAIVAPQTYPSAFTTMLFPAASLAHFILLRRFWVMARSVTEFTGGIHRRGSSHHVPCRSHGQKHVNLRRQFFSLVPLRRSDSSFCSSRHAALHWRQNEFSLLRVVIIRLRFTMTTILSIFRVTVVFVVNRCCCDNYSNFYLNFL